MFFTSALVSARLWARIAAGSRPAAPRAAVSPGAGKPRVAARDVRSSLVITRFCSRGFALPPSSEGRPAQCSGKFLRLLTTVVFCHDHTSYTAEGWNFLPKKPERAYTKTRKIARVPCLLLYNTVHLQDHLGLKHMVVAFPQHVREACAEIRNVDRGLTLAQLCHER
jgi:hypothetical protein